MLFTTGLLAGATLVSHVRASDLSQLPSFLKQTSDTAFPALKKVAVQIHENPELGRNEHLAHKLITDYFVGLDKGWEVTPHAYGMDTAFTAVFEHRPDGFDGELTTIGLLAEYDALIVGHACGHNHIALNGMTAATLAAEALVQFDVPGRIKLVGCPDEEDKAGKYALNNAGAFDDSDIWMMAHPTSANAIQPMNARLNLFPRFTGRTHQQAVRKAYEAMAIVANMSGTYPGTSSTASTIENVGIYAVNVVQTEIKFGISGARLSTVNATVSSILDKTYPNVTFTAAHDGNGVALTFDGPGGHASESTKGALDLSIATFRKFKDDAAVSFYLPGNTSVKELDITVDLRTRYTADLPGVADKVSAALGKLSSGLSNDLKYPALEIEPALSQYFLGLLATPDYGSQVWPISTFAPASSDASWLQAADVSPDTHEVLGVNKVILHANFGICGTNPGDPCAFNHEPLFVKVAGTDYSYTRTEIVARAEAHTVVELLANQELYDSVTAKVR
jgi:hypothetical protein